MNATIRGPLPPRVYWTRRLVLFGVVVLVLTLVVWLLSRGGDPAHASAGHEQPTTKTANERDVPQTTPADSPTTSPKPRKRDGQTRPRTQQPTQPVLAAPDGPCDPTKIDMKIDVADSEAGLPNLVTFLLTSTDKPACSLTITPDVVVVAVTSGIDRIWSSTDCPQALVAKQLVVRPDPPSAYQFTWDGRRSAESCAKAGAVPEPGGYWVEAAFIGGEPQKAYFDLTAGKGIAPTR